MHSAYQIIACLLKKNNASTAKYRKAAKCLSIALIPRIAFALRQCLHHWVFSEPASADCCPVTEAIASRMTWKRLRADAASAKVHRFLAMTIAVGTTCDDARDFTPFSLWGDGIRGSTYLFARDELHNIKQKGNGICKTNTKIQRGAWNEAEKEKAKQDMKFWVCFTTIDKLQRTLRSQRRLQKFFCLHCFTERDSVRKLKYPVTHTSFRFKPLFHCKRMKTFIVSKRQ